MANQRPRTSFFRRDDRSSTPAPEQREQRPVTERAPRPERPAFNRDDRRPSNRDERPAFNRDDRRPFNRDERPAFNRDDRRPSNRDERPAFNRDDRRPFNRDERPAFNRDDHRPFNRDERPSFNRDDRRPSNRDERPAFNRDDRPSFNRDDRRPSNRDERPAFNRDDRRPFNRDERPSFNRDDRRPSNRDDRKPFSHSDKPIFNREDKRAFDRADKPFEGEKFEGDGGRSLALRSRKPEKVRAKGAAPIKLEDPTEPIRLNRFIAMSGVCSRRQADDMITLGEVTVNGVVITELGTKVLRADKVELRGEQLRGEKMVYVIMNKPKGFVTSVDDPHNDKSVVDLLKGQIKERVYPVGRLDKNTTGVLLLTNDGQMTMELTHPSFEKRKIYHVFLDKPCTEADLEKLAKGVELEDGEIHADEVSFVDGNSKEVGVEIHSGRNRIIRRMFESLGYDVVRLDRVYFAGFTKMGLRRGFWRHLTEREVATLKGGVYR